MQDRVHQGKEKGTETNSHRASVRSELGGALVKFGLRKRQRVAK